MSSMIGSMPIWLLGALIFGLGLLTALLTYWLVMVIGKDFHWEVNLGFYSLFNITFSLIMGFLASQIWNDNNKAMSAVIKEASSIKQVMAASKIFPNPTRSEIQTLASDYVFNAINVEWPAMRSLSSYKEILDDSSQNALLKVMSIDPSGNPQASAKQMLLNAFNNLYDARSERILFAGTSVNAVKWFVVSMLAILLYLSTAMLYKKDVKGCRVALLVLTVAISLCFLMLLAHDRPFTGHVAISPELLLKALNN